MTTRVLIADSNPLRLDSFSDYLRDDGYDVISVSTGLDCVSHLRNSAADFLLLDDSLLWGSSWGVLELMCQDMDLPCLPFILMAGSNSVGVPHKLSSFPHCVVAKPVSARRVARMLRWFAGHHLAVKR